MFFHNIRYSMLLQEFYGLNFPRIRLTENTALCTNGKIMKQRLKCRWNKIRELLCRGSSNREISFARSNIWTSWPHLVFSLGRVSSLLFPDVHRTRRLAKRGEKGPCAHVWREKNWFGDECGPFAL